MLYNRLVSKERGVRKPPTKADKSRRKEKRMSRNKRPKYSPEICGRMYRLFLGYEDRGLRSFTKFARSEGLSTEDLLRFRGRKKFEVAYQECLQIRRDYLIDRALDKRFDGSFVKFLISCEVESESSDNAGNITLNLRVTE
jgi:hypothetical protein